MKPLRRGAMRRLVPMVVLCGFSFCGAIAGESPQPPPVEATRQVDAATRRIEFRDAESLLLEYPDYLTTVTSFDPSVIRVSAVRPNCLRVQRVSQGTATLRAVDRSDHRYSVEVVVLAADGRK
jgi:hypothetical protein